MGSPASSDELGYRYPENPQPVKGLGLSWLKRGSGYWARRIILALGRLFIMLLMAIMAAAGVSEVLSNQLNGFQRDAFGIATAVLLAIGLALGVREAHASNTSLLRACLMW